MSGSEHTAAADVAKEQLRVFLSTAERAGMDSEQVRRFVRLSQQDWQQWLGVLGDEPLPEGPALPLVLRHLGYLTSRLDRAARPQSHA